MSADSKPRFALPGVLLLALGTLGGLDACDGCDGPAADDDATADDDDASGDDDDAGDDDSADDDTGDDDTTPVDPLAALSPCDGGVLFALSGDEIAPPAPNSDGYQAPPAFVLDGVEDSIAAILGGDGEASLAALDGTDYEVCRGEGLEQGLVLWRPLSTGTGRALVAWRSGPARPLIVGLPHAHHELVTLEEGVTIFDRLDGRALIASGTHRCANTATTVCDGIGESCAAEEAPFRESDMAHVVDSVFQVAHEVLADHYSDDWVLSIHGMMNSGISVADGTTSDTTLGTPVAELTAELMDTFPGEWVTTCNAWPGAVVEERLCGTFNVQGRLINASHDPCIEDAGLSSGRFLHLEQSATVREFPDLVIGALDAVVPAAR